PYSGPNSVLYVLSGTLTVALDGTTQTVSEGAGVFIPAVRTTVFGATGIEPAHFLQFVLAPAAEAQKSPLGGSASSEELYRKAERLRGFQVDRKLKFRRLLDGNVPRPRAPEDFLDALRRTPVDF